MLVSWEDLCLCKAAKHNFTLVMCQCHIWLESKYLLILGRVDNEQKISRHSIIRSACGVFTSPSLDMKDQSRGAIAKVTHWIWKSWNPIIGLGDQYQLSTIHIQMYLFVIKVATFPSIMIIFQFKEHPFAPLCMLLHAPPEFEFFYGYRWQL